MTATTTRKPRVFLSRTTAGLATLAEKVAVILAERGWEVIHQPAFNLEWRRIRHMLMEKIREADAVVCLVGPVHGFAPATPIPEFRDPETGREEFSYTQLEFLIARRLHKPLVTLLVPEALCTFFPGDDPGTPAQQALQADFIRDYIKKGEHVYHEFTSKADLLGAVRGRLIEIPHSLLPPAPENIPFPSIGTLFTGRDETLRALRESLLAADAAPGAVPGLPVVQLIHGTGGVGKTRLAVEYARRFPEGYNARLFLRGSSPGAIDESLASLAGLFLLNLPEQDEKETEVRVAAVIRWLAAHPGYLLVIDNVDTQEARDHAAALLAKLPPGHILLTSRLHTWPGDILRTPLPVLADTAAATLLLKYRSAPKAPAANADPAAALALARDLDGLALGILQATAYLNAVAITIAEYHQRWKSNAELVRSWHDPARADYPASVATTWLTTFDQLAPASQALLNLLAWFAPDPIPRFILKPLAEKKLHPDPLLGTDPYKALGELVNYSLAQPDTAGTAFSVHRLIQQVSADRQPNPPPPPALISALAWINGEMPDGTEDVRTWPVVVPLTPHAVAAATFGADRGIPDPTSRLFNQAAILLATQANHRTAEPLYRRALAIDEAAFGKDHPKVAIRLNNLAGLLEATNRLAEAEPLMLQALAIDEAALGKDHPKVAIRLNNLANLLHAVNRLAEAEPLMRRALAIDEAALGKNHPDVALRLNNLAGLLETTNRLAEAEELYRHALAIWETSLGKNHPDVAVALNNLAQLLKNTNRLAEAEPLMLQALAIDEAALGKDHPIVAIRLNNLANLLHALNRLAEAEPLYLRSIAISEVSLGENHTQVAAPLINFAKLLQATNRLAEAEPLMRQALSIYEASFGSDHPHVATSLNELGQLLHATNRLAEAEPIYRRAYAIFAASLGGSHPHVATVLNSLAGLFRDTNRHAEAEPLMHRVVDILVDCTRATRHPHPHLNTALNDYCGLLVKLGATQAQIVEKLNRLLAPIGASVG